MRVRDGHTGAREAGRIGFASLRGGSVVGDHSVILRALRNASRCRITPKIVEFLRAALCERLYGDVVISRVSIQ